MENQPGRRERKKAQTRKALADAALELFLARGYDQVAVKEVANAADVSVTTLFKYFPTKEALVFDLDAEIETGLMAAVRERAPGRSIPRALREHILNWVDEVTTSPHTEAFTRLIEQTPALRAYGARMWLRHETTLARTIAADIGAPEEDVTCAALARFALESVDLARRYPDAPQALGPIFDLLERGWSAARP
ncbi:TetR/AcrR family transcriptional regulator [Amycolatopsis samaneae]|uniref:TetR/AcrR family transcriptional regulator n=1 Tax=Amycolatopsis samaneae TaxID=664691 RepID=A0ABW5GQ88_9PSEU